MRRSYLDRIRACTVLLVLLYHVFYLFNGVGVPGGIPGARSIPVFDRLAGLVYPWFMVLLFLIAGMSARYALQRRTERQFIRERAVKLLIPSTLGLFVLHWITGYLNLKVGGALGYIPAPLVYPISVISGIGPLWFIQLLFLFSCLLVFLRRLDRSDRVWTVCAGAGTPVILLLFLPVFAGAQVLNMPLLTMYRLGIYGVSFLTGYYVFSHEGVQERIEALRVPMLCLAAAGAAAYDMRFGGTDYTAPACLQSLTTNLYLWAAVLAVLGWGKRCWDRETAFSRYLTKSSFGLYVLHYPVLMAVCCTLQYRFDLPALWNYVLAFGLEILLTCALYGAVRRLPWVSFLVLGLKKSGRAGADRPAGG